MEINDNPVEHRGPLSSHNPSMSRISSTDRTHHGQHLASTSTTSAAKTTCSITSAAKTALKNSNKQSSGVKQQRFRADDEYQTPVAVRGSDISRSNGESGDENDSAGRLTNNKRKSIQKDKFYPSDDSSADEKYKR
jgi:hypothetical protein